LDRSFEKLSCQPVIFAAIAPQVLDTSKQAFIGRQTLGALMHRPPHFGVLDPPGECCDDVARDFVLHLEQCANLTIEALRPEMVSGSGVDQLRGYAHPRVGASDAAFHDISHAKLAADL